MPLFRKECRRYQNADDNDSTKPTLGFLNSYKNDVIGGIESDSKWTCVILGFFAFLMGGLMLAIPLNACSRYFNQME